MNRAVIVSGEASETDSEEEYNYVITFTLGIYHKLFCFFSNF